MTLNLLDKTAGTRVARGLTYAEKPLGGQMVPLTMDLFVPKAAATPAPLLVWLGADILTDRAINPKGPQRLADVLTRKGVALAAPTVRVGANRSDLPDAAIEGLGRLEPQRDLSVHPDLSTSLGLGATEDICALLSFVAVKGEKLGLSGRTVLSGASIGAGLAFNVAVAAPHLGLERPAPVGVLSYSGTCAWPGLHEPGGLRVFALHNPLDDRMPIHPVRTMAAQDPLFELIESMEQAHGSLGLWPEEPALQACMRIHSRVIEWSAA
ncbi:MAG: hypothetical protein AAF641_06010 [Pseudomonadota bacterium]